MHFNINYHYFTRVPTLRLLIPFVVGIILGWLNIIPISLLLIIWSSFIICLLVFFTLRLSFKYRLKIYNGILINLLLLSSGAILYWKNDIRNDKLYVGYQYKNANYVIAQLEEPLTEKDKNFKAIAGLKGLIVENTFKEVHGKIIIYFKKDPISSHIQYGSQILFKALLQPIKNSGNPGSFDNQQYCLFLGITHQVLLSDKDYLELPQSSVNSFTSFILHCRNTILNIIWNAIRDAKQRGLAEALLIGYKDDLDKQLVQSYINTGVVHIIAISGMHLGIIYGILLFLTRPLKKKKQLLWVQSLIILSGLWIFSILTGAQPSILRSAVIFSCLVLAEPLSRRTSAYNSLALSAFLLLCYDPFWLWDPGFLLSYAAVSSIVLFFKPIYNLVYFPNKLLNSVWKLIAVSLSAQLLPFPVSIYFFHQLPLLFLFVNLVAVPLSSLILFAEIILCCISWCTPLFRISAWVTEWMLSCMNNYVERFDTVSFSVWRGLSISAIQAVLLTLAICTAAYWLMQKKKTGLWISLSAILIFTLFRSTSFIHSYHQKNIIVYNIPHEAIIEVIKGTSYQFIGNDTDWKNEQIYNKYIQPAHTLLRLNEETTNTGNRNELVIDNKKIIILDSAHNISSDTKDSLFLLILTGKPRLHLAEISPLVKINKIVIDPSVPFWKAMRFQKECDSLHIPCYNVRERGAFIAELNK